MYETLVSEIYAHGDPLWDEMEADLNWTSTGPDYKACLTYWDKHPLLSSLTEAGKLLDVYRPKPTPVTYDDDDIPF